MYAKKKKKQKPVLGVANYSRDRLHSCSRLRRSPNACARGDGFVDLARNDHRKWEFEAIEIRKRSNSGDTRLALLNLAATTCIGRNLSFHIIVD